MKNIVSALMGVAFAIAVSTGADAHPFGLHGGGFTSGLSHPFGGLDHLLAMVAVGLWAAQYGGRALWLMPATFISAMLAGGALALNGLSLPAVELGIAASLMLFGSVVALAVRPPLVAGVLTVAGFAVLHGHAHGAEMPQTAAPLLYAVGFVVATAVLHGLGVLGALAALRQDGARHIGAWLVRGAGSVVAGYGLLAAIS